MSLDIRLTADVPVVKRGTGVFVRRDGGNVELTAQEVKEQWPDSNVTERTYVTNEVYHVNITHNLNKMAMEAEVYQAMWRPEEEGYTIARDLIEPLSHGLVLLLTDPERFREFNPENGWGNYEQLVDTVRSYLIACSEYPTATIAVDK